MTGTSPPPAQRQPPNVNGTLCESHIRSKHAAAARKPAPPHSNAVALHRVNVSAAVRKTAGMHAPPCPQNIFLNPGLPRRFSANSNPHRSAPLVPCEDQLFSPRTTLAANGQPRACRYHWDIQPLRPLHQLATSIRRPAHSFPCQPALRLQRFGRQKSRQQSRSTSCAEATQHRS